MDLSLHAALPMTSARLSHAAIDFDRISSAQCTVRTCAVVPVGGRQRDGPKRLRYVLVNVIGVAGICREQVLDVSEIGPVIVETTPKTTVIVPASRPEQDG